MNSNIQEIRKKRFQYLHKMYEISGGSQSTFLDINEIGNKLGFSEEETAIIVEYLAGENLIRKVSRSIISITHYGVVQIEEALAEPEQQTHYFPPVNIININQMTGSQIQQGTSQSNQLMTVSTVDLEAISKFIEELKNKLPELQLEKESQKEAEADISTVEAQIKSPKSKHSIISECLKSLRSILENAAGQEIATLLLGQIPRF